MKKIDIIAPLVIGEICAIIFILVSGVLEVPDIVNKVSKTFPIVLPALSLAGVFFVSWLSKKRPTLFQFGKSFLIGILNTFIDLGILNFLMWITAVASGWLYSVFKAFSFGTSVFNSYLWNKIWAFEKKEGNKGKELLKFYSVTLGGLLIHLLVSGFVVNVIKPQFGLSDQIWGTLGGVAAALVGFSWNFFGYKFLVFKK